MKFLIFILTVFALNQTRGTTTVRNSVGEQSIPSVIRAYEEKLDNFYKNRTFEFDDYELQRSVPTPTQLALKSVANNLLFYRTSVDGFCRLAGNTRYIDENAKISFLTDIGNLLREMKQSIPLDFITAGNPENEAAAHITIDVTKNNFVLRSDSAGGWKQPAPKLYSILRNVTLTIPPNVVPSSKTYRFSTVSHLQVFQKTTAVFLRHIDEVLSKISFATSNSREAILEACRDTGRFIRASNKENSNELSERQFEEQTERQFEKQTERKPPQKPFTPCASDAVYESTESLCTSNCENCSLMLCKSTLSYLIHIGSNTVEPEKTYKYTNFLDLISPNYNHVCVSIFHHFLLHRHPMMSEAYRKMKSGRYMVYFSTTSASPYNVQTQIFIQGY